MHRTPPPPAPRHGRLPRFLRRRQLVPHRVLAALCAALAAPVSAPALLATGATALLAASAPGPAWAANNPIPGIGVVVKKNPGGGAHKTVTNQDGRYDFKDLEPGTYDLLIEGQAPRKVEVGKDGRLSGVVTRPVKPTVPLTAEPAQNANVVRGGPGALQPPGPAASDIRSVPTGHPTPVPPRAAVATPPADAASSELDRARPAVAPLARQTVQVQALGDGYVVKLAGQAQGFKLNTVIDMIDEMPAGLAARPAGEAPAPARLQAWLKDLKTGRITPLAASADGFALPSGLDDGVHRYALKVSGGGLGERPCPPGCSAPGYLTISIDKGTYKSAGSPKAAGF